MVKSSEETPSYMDFTGTNGETVWDIGIEPNPQLLAEYLTWLLNDDTRVEEAVSAMQWYPPGFHGLLVAVDKRNNQPTHERSLQLNFYNPNFPGDEEPHAHSRDARSWWCALPGVEQTLVRYRHLPEGTKPIAGLMIEEREAIAMNIGDRGDGKRPIYLPSTLGRALVLISSISNVAGLGSQLFTGPEVHHAGARFPSESTAISVHWKGPEENPELSDTMNGLMRVKGLSQEQAEMVLAERAALGSAHEKFRLAAATMLYLNESQLDQIINRPEIPDPNFDECYQLIVQGLRTALKVAKAA